MLTRRKLFGMLAGVLAAPKELLAKPLLMKFRQPGPTTSAFDTAYMEADAAMKFDVKDYSRFLVIESTAAGHADWLKQERDRRLREMAKDVASC